MDIYTFSKQHTDGNKELNHLLGGKGANLAEMCNIGLNIPPGFTISTNICKIYNKHGSITNDIIENIINAVKHLEEMIGSSFGKGDNPLLLSVRSGSPISMPGMLDTILNLGLNDQTVISLAEYNKDDRFAQDSYRRFIQMYGNVVMEVDHSKFSNLLMDKKQKYNITEDSKLGIGHLKELVTEFKLLIQRETNLEFPQDTFVQLKEAIYAVFRSWNNNRAITYRKLNHIQDDLGTAVNIQTMVFGNKGATSSSGVVFTRNPSTGKNEIFGEYLPNAQGEDVVDGSRTPNPISEANKEASGSEKISLEESFPSIFQELCSICTTLEQHYKDMQDIEFTVQEGKLWILQTRFGKRSQQAALRIAIDMVEEGLLTKEEAVRNINPDDISQILHPTIDASDTRKPLTKGLPASPGAACGMVVFSSSEAKKISDRGMDVLLVRNETTPEDIEGMASATGILTTRGGMTSHAAVIARGMGKPCVCGAGEININYKDKYFLIEDLKIKEGEKITINGSTGEIIPGETKTSIASTSEELSKILEWSEHMATMVVRANADNNQDSKTSLKFRAKGIGLCRTEHMFFQKDRILIVREMIMASSEEARRAALHKILKMQKEDLIEIFKLMRNKPTNVRLLDPPLHEFLPLEEELVVEMAAHLNISQDRARNRIQKLQESNPMLGHRGCRLAITYPEIYEMQVSAIMSAASEVQHNHDIELDIEIMVPLVMNAMEYNKIRSIIERVATETMNNYKSKIKFSIGVMIELPIAAINAGSIVKNADFICFGTNDLTQTTLGISRDDASKFIPTYVEKGIFEHDPFTTISNDVIKIMELAIKEARRVKPNIKIGVCGEHGGDPISIHRFGAIGIDYVSCSPYRIPIAKIAAAQAVQINEKVALTT